MSVTIFERLKSRDTVIDIKAGSTVVEYLAWAVAPFDVSDNEDVKNAMLAAAPLRNGFQLRRTIDCKNQAGPLWFCTVTYGTDEGDVVSGIAGDPLPFQFSFDTTGGNQHITQSIDTMDAVRYVDPATVRTVSDAVYNGTTTVTSATAAFTAADVGKIVMSAPKVRTVGDAAVSGPFPNQLTSASAAFTSADVGAILSTLTQSGLPAPNNLVIPPGTTILSVDSPTAISMSNEATITPVSGLNLTIRPTITNFTTRTTIASVTNATTAVLSNAAVLNAAGQNLTIGGLPPVNFGRAIGVSKDGVAGCDKIAPKTELVLTRRFQFISTELIKLFREMTGTMNDAPFYGFQPGEALFLGASGQPSGNNTSDQFPECSVTFKFAGSPNESDIDILPPDEATGQPVLRISYKRGWDYLWVYYVDAKDPVSRRAISRPEAAYVEQIYAESDFSQLGIGTSGAG